MNKTSQTNEDAFIQSTTEIAGLKLRPFSLGSFNICRKLKLSILTGEGNTEISEEEKQNQILAFIYIQTQPIADVLKAIKSPSFFDDYVLPFSMSLPINAMPAAISEIHRVIDEASSAFVEVLPKKGDVLEEELPN